MAGLAPAAGKFVVSAASLELGSNFPLWGGLAVFSLPFPRILASSEHTAFAAGFSRPFLPRGAVWKSRVSWNLSLLGDCWRLFAPGEIRNVKRAFARLPKFKRLCVCV